MTTDEITFAIEKCDLKQLMTIRRALDARVEKITADFMKQAADYTGKKPRKPRDNSSKHHDEPDLEATEQPQ